MTRVWVPATVERLSRWVQAGEIAPEPAVERLLAADETEEAEYAALLEAADASAALLAGAGRRVVVVAELGETADPDAVIALRRVVAVHVDTEVGADPDDDLGWWAPQEIPHLLETLVGLEP